MASSDGWMRDEPAPSQRREPLTVSPTPGTSTNDEQPEADEQPERRELAPAVVVDAHRDEERDEAEHRPHRLAVEVHHDEP